MKKPIKLQINVAKPRNPIALSARQRRAGAHQPDNLPRHERRIQKQQLRHFLLGRNKNREMDV
jgi:hypothetical protein